MSCPVCGEYKASKCVCSNEARELAYLREEMEENTSEYEAILERLNNIERKLDLLFAHQNKDSQHQSND